MMAMAMAIDQSHKSHNASDKYPTMHHFVLLNKQSSNCWFEAAWCWCNIAVMLWGWGMGSIADHWIMCIYTTLDCCINMSIFITGCVWQHWSSVHSGDWQLTFLITISYQYSYNYRHDECPTSPESVLHVGLSAEEADDALLAHYEEEVQTGAT